MGILITQREDVWKVSLKEDWLLKNRENVLELSDFLIKNKISFKTKCMMDYCLISFENDCFESTDFGAIKKILTELLHYKNDYGKVFNKDREHPLGARVKDFNKNNNVCLCKATAKITEA